MMFILQHADVSIVHFTKYLMLNDNKRILILIQI